MSSNKTPNLALHSWVGTDNVKREEFNENFDVLDGTIKSHADRLDAVETANTNDDGRLDTLETDKQNKFTFVSGVEESFPASGMEDGDFHVFEDTSKSVVRLYRYNTNDVGWNLISSNDSSDMKHGLSNLSDVVNNKLNIGDYGIGGTGKNISNTDINALLSQPSGYYAGNNLTNAPANSYYHILHLKWDSGKIYQCLYRQSPTRYVEQYFRVYDTTGGWTAWERVLNTATFQAGYTAITPSSAGARTTKRVTFAKPFITAPMVSATPFSSAPDAVRVSVNNITTTYADIVLWRSDTIETYIHWMATEPTQ